jgi:hypothetical protein
MFKYKHNYNSFNSLFQGSILKKAWIPIMNEKFTFLVQKVKFLFLDLSIIETANFTGNNPNAATGSNTPATLPLYEING